ncbi:MAG: hemerythrin family protein [Selenomonadaceae bacterium]|nr:hemerythrin family protein [Selenomonadaceae bacterium]
MTSMQYEFTDDFLTGIDFIDKEHAHLFELANETYDLLRNELIPDKYDRIIDLIEELREYTKTHFADEEEFMEAIDFKKLWTEKHQHITFVKKLEDIDTQKLDDHQDAYILDILDFLAKWLTGHIKGVDRQIGEAVRAMGKDDRAKADAKAAEILSRVSFD